MVINPCPQNCIKIFVDIFSPNKSTGYTFQNIKKNLSWWLFLFIPKMHICIVYNLSRCYVLVSTKTNSFPWKVENKKFLFQARLTICIFLYILLFIRIEVEPEKFFVVKIFFSYVLNNFFGSFVVTTTTTPQIRHDKCFSYFFRFFVFLCLACTFVV